MKRIATIAIILFSNPALAEDAKPAPRTACGATAEECQKKIDAMGQADQKKINVYKELLNEANARFAEQAAR